jgi:methylenetetrahydrofolate reductase (NADPH)
MMKWMDENVPGVVVAKEIKERLTKAKEKGGKEAIADENVAIFSEFILELQKTTRAAGVHVMAVGYEKIVPKIIAAARRY